jgi:protein-S-isoprenylcysteine O-methyltransferase Ste14
MNQTPRYSATRAAAFALGIAVVASIFLIAGGVRFLREGSSSGWLLIGAGLLPVLFGIGVFRWTRRQAAPPQDKDPPPRWG